MLPSQFSSKQAASGLGDFYSTREEENAFWDPAPLALQTPFRLDAIAL